MLSRRTCPILAVGALVVALPAQAQTYSAGSSAAWWTQIGLTSTIENTATGGSGVTIGMVDTGVVATNSEIVGRVSSASSCAAVTFVCSKSYTDDNGHGSATAAIAAGSTATGGTMSGVASKATILSEKVLNASGAGYDNDVANGIIKATNAGASVINLSLTYSPSSTVVNAINYAAARNVVIVFAAGNSGTLINSGRSTVGLTTQALRQLVLVGSVNSNNTISSFSNTAGVASAGTGTSYASIWLSAPGENITAPLIKSGSNAYGTWSGTSMAAPIISGSIALLEARWPVLRTNQTATSLLFATTTDLGKTGVDSTYGNGLLNLIKAFAPVGSLSVATSKGTTTVTASMISSGAVGVSALKSVLGSVAGYDSYKRDFQVNLSSGVSTASSSVSTASTSSTTTTKTTATKLTDSATLVTSFAEESAPLSVRTAARINGLAGDDTARHLADRYRVAYFTDQGAYLSFGRGIGGADSFAEATWSPDSAFADSGTGTAGSALMALIPNPDHVALAQPVGTAGRLAFGYVGADHGLYEGATGNQQKMHSLAASYTYRVQPGWTAGLSTTLLEEHNSLLGAAAGGAIHLGDHRSTAVTLGQEVALDEHTRLGVDATYAAIGGATPSSGVIDRLGGMQAAGLSATLARHDSWVAGDSLSIGVGKPLQLISGHADVTVSVGADAMGAPLMRTSRVTLVPDGSQTDLTVGYRRAFFDGQASGYAQLRVSSDQDNIHGKAGGGVMVGGKLAF